MPGETVGKRITFYRRRRGLSQVVLAGLLGRSESWLSQIERGLRTVDRLSVLQHMAEILGVGIDELTGNNRRIASTDRCATDLETIRRLFSGYDHLLNIDPSTPTISLSALQTRTSNAHQLYQAACYGNLIVNTPNLLKTTEQLRSTVEAKNRRELLKVYVSAYTVTAKLVTKLGVGDLALLAADRCANAASELDSSAARSMAAYQVVCALFRDKRPAEAEQLAVGAAEQAERMISSQGPDLISFAGALWLIGAVIAARRLDGSEARLRLCRAESLAGAVGRDANFGWTAFGPTNVAIHRVSVAAALGDAAEALREADRINFEFLPAGLKSRRAQVHLDLAWAYSRRRRDADAVLHLLEAEKLAP